MSWFKDSLAIVVAVIALFGSVSATGVAVYQANAATVVNLRQDATLLDHAKRIERIDGGIDKLDALIKRLETQVDRLEQKSK